MRYGWVVGCNVRALRKGVTSMETMSKPELFYLKKATAFLKALTRLIKAVTRAVNR